LSVLAVHARSISPLLTAVAVRLPGAVGAVVSGAGPSILVLCSDPAQRLAAADLVAKHQATPWQSLLLAVDFKGATVITHSVDISATSAD